MAEKRLQRTREAYAPPKVQTVDTSAVKQQDGGHPHQLGGRGKGGEYISEHHRGARRKG